MNIRLAFLLLAAVALGSCKEPASPTYSKDRPDPFPTGGEPPVITSVVPDKGFAGDEVVISGSGFKTGPNETMVNIGTVTAEILSITDTQLRIRMPVTASGPKRVRVAVWGAEKWSNELNYTYLNDFLLYPFTMPNIVGVAVDDAGNLYVGSSNENRIYKMDGLDSTITVFANAANIRGPMEFGPDGDLYFVSQTGIDKVTPAGVVSNLLTQASVQDFDWAENGDLYFVVPTRVRRWNGTTHAEVGTITQGRRIRVYEDHVYVTEFTQLRVSKFQINANGTLGPRAVAYQSNTAIQNIEFDSDGNMYIGGFTRDYIFKAAPDRVNDGDITEIPTVEDRENPFRRISTGVSEIKIERSVMYVVQSVPNGQVGKVWRIFINAYPAPRHGRE